MYVLAGVLAALVVIVAAGTFGLRQRADAAITHVTTVVTPAQTAANGLVTAYVEQANEVRGFLLTDDPSFMRAYSAAQADAARLRAIVSRQLAADPGVEHLLGQVDEAARAWQQVSIQPELDAAAKAPGPLVLPDGDSLQEQQRFDDLRGRLTDLDSYLNGIAAREVGAARSAQAAANWLSLWTGVSALLVAALTVLVLRKVLSRPLNGLLSQVDQVAGGELDRPVREVGPAELAEIARAVDTMRVRILSEMSRSAEAQKDLARHEQAERIALGLHDQVIQRLAGARMLMHHVVSQHPAVKIELAESDAHIDRAIRELRTVIFNLTTASPDAQRLRQRVLELADEYETILGFPPNVRLDGAIDLLVPAPFIDELLPAMQEGLSNVAQHSRATAVEVGLTVTGDELVLRISDNGTGMVQNTKSDGEGLRNLHRRAERLGGSCTIESGPAGGTTVEWRVPLTPE